MRTTQTSSLRFEVPLRDPGWKFSVARESSGAARCFHVFCLAALVLAGGVVGCVPSDHEINDFIHAWEASVSASDYRVQPPDTIQISSPMAPEVDGQSQTIRQDGKVTLRLIGEVKVAGMTPVEIGRKLESLLKKYYMDPQVSVAVSGSGSKHIYVFGQVAAVGALPYTGRDTLLDVLSKARPTIGAWKSRVKVIHPSHEEGKRRVITVNVDRIMKEGKLDQNILLQEGDILYIPPTPLTWIALRVRELLYPFEPSVGNVGILSAGGTTMGVTSRQLGGY